MKIALTGNPNSGKTTLFNLLTGGSEKVGNWAGVTVDKKEGELKKALNKSGKSIKIIDLPGAYSMSPFTSEESVTRDFIKNEKVFLYNELRKFKELEVFEGAVNFIFFKTRTDINLKEELIKHGIIIRSCSNYIGLGLDYYRVAVRTREQNERLIYALRKVFNK